LVAYFTGGIPMNKNRSLIRIATIIILTTLLSATVNLSPVLSDGSNTTYLPLIINDSDSNPTTPLVVNFDHYGPEGGTVTALATLPDQTDLIYAGSWGSGVFKSVDHGDTWTFASHGLTNLFVYSLAIDPTNPDIVYAGTYYDGVYKTVDGGDNWTQVSDGLNDSAVVYVLAVNPENPEILFAGTRGDNNDNTSYCSGTIYNWGGGVFRSANGGASWTQVDGGQACGYVYGMAIDPTDADIVYVASHEKGVLKSTDGGLTFSYKNTGLSDLATRTIVVDPDVPSRLFVSSWHGGAVFISNNSGTSWSTVNSGISGYNVFKLGLDPDYRSSSNCAALYGTVWGSGNGLIRSLNCGSTWANLGPGSYAQYVYALALATPDEDSAADLFFGISAVGVFTSSNLGVTWVEANDGLTNTSINTLAYAPTDETTLYAGTVNSGIFKSEDNGETWTASRAGLPFGTGAYSSILRIVVDPTNSNILYAGTDGNGIYKSTDGGANWSSSNTGIASITGSELAGINSSTVFPGSVPYDAPFFDESLEPNDLQSQNTSLGTKAFAALVINPASHTTVYAGSGNGVYKSTNSGSNWSLTSLSGVEVFSLAIDPNSTTTLYAGTEEGVYKTTNSGSSWSLVSASTGLIYDIDIDPSNSNLIYASTSDAGVYRTTDGGSTWLIYDIGIEGLTVYSLAIDENDSSILYAGTSEGLYRMNTSEGEWQWIELDDQVSFVDPVMTKADSADTVFMGTRSGTIIATITD
jgi:photosystem II stability/assembly factor-like uncharacterized protein